MGSLAGRVATKGKKEGEERREAGSRSKLAGKRGSGISEFLKCMLAGVLRLE